MKDISVQFPKPCDEDWDNMAPRGCNRHCASCDKIIHDLSKLTVEQTDSLLDQHEEVCVRATVTQDGTVLSADTRSGASRRIVAMVGASMTLATAACQTAVLSPVSPRHEITGQLKSGSWAYNAKLVSTTGKSYSRKIRGDQKFQFSNLRTGTYNLTFYGSCGEKYTFDNIAVTDDLDMGELEWEDKADCIIIGVMERIDKDGYG